VIFSRPRECAYLFSIIIFFSVLSGCIGEEQKSRGSSRGSSQGSSQGSSPEISGTEKFEKRELIIEGNNRKVIVNAEIARTDAQRQQGLMYRKELKEDEAMLFIFERDQVLSFWMKNTLIPLSIAYVAHDGRILEIHDLEPGNLDPVSSSRSVRYALEVNRGWFDRAGLTLGDRLNINGF